MPARYLSKVDALVVAHAKACREVEKLQEKYRRACDRAAKSRSGPDNSEVIILEEQLRFAASRASALKMRLKHESCQQSDKQQPTK